MTETEKVGIAIAFDDVKETAKRGGLCLVGKLLMARVVSGEILRTTLLRAWRLTESANFTTLNDNLFLIEFDLIDDLEHVLEGGPWLFDNFLVALQTFDGSIPPDKIEFSKTALWVQIHGLPLVCMNKDVCHKIGNSLGTVRGIDVGEDGIGWGRYIRVRVEIDLGRPLARGRLLNLMGSEYWVSFRYEKLPKFCFSCGIINHGERGCPVNSIKRLHGEVDQQYGTWLRAQSPNRNRRMGGVPGGSRAARDRRDGSHSEETSDSDGTQGRRGGSQEPAQREVGGGSPLPAAAVLPPGHLKLAQGTNVTATSVNSGTPSMHSRTQKERGDNPGFPCPAGAQKGNVSPEVVDSAKIQEVFMADSEDLPTMETERISAKTGGDKAKGRRLHSGTLGIPCPIYGDKSSAGCGPGVIGLDLEPTLGFSLPSIPQPSPLNVDTQGLGPTEMGPPLTNPSIPKDKMTMAHGMGEKNSACRNETTTEHSTQKVKSWKKRARAGNGGIRNQSQLPIILGKRRSEETDPLAVQSKKQCKVNEEQFNSSLAEVVEQPRQSP